MNTHSTLHGQRGAVLIISLIILMVLTVIGVTGMSNTSLDERMSQNFEQKNLVFQAAESAIENIMVASNPDQTVNPLYVLDDDPIDQLYTLGASATLTIAYTPGDLLNNADIETEATLSFGPDVLCVGAGKGAKCRVVEADVVAQIDTTNTSANHVQGIYRVLTTGNENDF